MQARSDLHRRKISQQGSDAVSDSEQKEALREAMRRLRIAEEKVALVKKLIPQLHHAIAEYHSHSQPLGDHISPAGSRSRCNVLERMVLSLEAYVATTAPSAPRLDAGRGGSPRPRPTTTASSATAAPGRGAATAETGGGRRTRRRRHRHRPVTAAATGRRGRPAGEDLIHERPIRPAPARPEDPAREVGHRQRRPGTTPPPVTSRRSTSSRWSRRPSTRSSAWRSSPRCSARSGPSAKKISGKWQVRGRAALHGPCHVRRRSPANRRLHLVPPTCHRSLATCH